MTTYAAFLRGINVGRNKRVAMADLRAILSELGYTQVATLLNSGNAVFDGPDGPSVDIAATIERTIRERLGLEVRVAVRTRADLERILDATAIPDALADPSHYLVAFLVTPMPAERVAAFDPSAFDPEVVRLGDGVAYLWYREGIGESKLTIDVLERRLGATVTARNWNTVTKLLALAARSG